MQDVALGGNRLSMPRVLRTGHALSLPQIKGVAPAVFADGPHSERGLSYAYIPTIRVVEALMEKGFEIMEVSQQRSRKADRDPYTKHMLRMRPQGYSAKKSIGGMPEVVLINAHDGTAAYHLYAGFFRFICNNGMIIGDVMQAIKVRHTTADVTRKLVVTGGERLVLDMFPKVVKNVEIMQETKLLPGMAEAFAQHALKLRYGDTVAPFPATDLLNVRRNEDRGDDLWTTFNVIQENVMNGGWESRSAMFNRRTTVRNVERVSSVVAINRGLWDYAGTLAAAAIAKASKAP